MKQVYPFLLLLLATACVSPYVGVPMPEPASLNLLPRQHNADVYYPGYRMPQRAYYEMGVFEFALPVQAGAPENHLRQELIKRNLDGAIILDRRRTWNIFDIEEERLTCMGLLYADNVEEVEWVSAVNIELYEGDSLTATCEIKFSQTGQIIKTSGSNYLASMAQVIQPWYFLVQANSLWSQKPNGSPYPSRRYRVGSSYMYWLNKSTGATPYYELHMVPYRKVGLYLADIGGQLVPRKVVEGDDAGEVQSLFLVDRLKKQVWHRTSRKQKIVYKYSYQTMATQQFFPLVEPEDLQQ